VTLEQVYDGHRGTGTGLLWIVAVREVRVGTVTVGQFFLGVLRFSPASIILLMLNSYLYLHVALKGKTTGEAWKFSKSKSISKIGENWREYQSTSFIR